MKAGLKEWPLPGDSLFMTIYDWRKDSWMSLSDRICLILENPGYHKKFMQYYDAHSFPDAAFIEDMT